VGVGGKLGGKGEKEGGRKGFRGCLLLEIFEKNKNKNY